MLRLSWMVGAMWVIFVALVPSVAAQEDKVIRSLTPDATEAILKSLKIDANKLPAPKKGDERYFEFTRGTFKIRLTQFSPTELMLDCVFRGVPLEKVNQWNTTTKVARVNYQKEGNGEVTVLEYGLDLSGGVSEGAVKQFVLRFDDELKRYDRFITSQVVDENILENVTSDKIENILKTLGLTFQKKQNSSGVVMYDFELNNKVRLYNFGGKDLMMDVHFRKLPLEEANKYNLSRKFIRAVNYKAKDVEYTALEINFDCEAGVTESMIRHWIASFGEDVRHFTEYTKKQQNPEKKSQDPEKK